MKKAIIPLFVFILTVFGIIFYVSKFGVVTNIGMKSIALSNSVMLKNLTNGKDEEVIKYETVDANETLYRFGSKYYVGENKRRYVADDFPIMSEDGSVLLIVNELGNYIDESFIKTKAYKDNIIVDSHLYNAVNNEQIDDLEYLFLEMNNGIFVNVSKLTIHIDKEDIIIPTNSYIFFSKNSLCYYYLKDSKFIYDEIPVIDDNERVNIGKYDISYNELMVYLGIKKDEKIIEDIKVEEEIEVEEEEEEEQVEEEKDTRVLLDVKVNDVKANIYSISGNISIIDVAGAIIKNPTIELKKDGKLFLRKTVEDGDFLLSGLTSDSEYEMKVSYIYVRDNKRYEKVIYNEIVKTKSRDELESIKLNVDSIETTTDNIVFNNIKLLNGIDDEVLRGIKSVVVKIGNNTVTLDAKRRNDLLKLETINFESEHIFESNTKYDIEFKFIDVDDKEIKVDNNKYSVVTKKNAPVGKINVKLDKNFKRAGITFNVNNVDEVNVESYIYNVYDESNNIVSSGKFVDNKYFVEIDSLNNASKYIVKLFTTYFDSDGSKVDNLEIASADFITYDFKKMGEISFSIKENIGDGKETSITSNSGSFIINYTDYNNEDVIYSLIDYDVKVQVVNVKTSEVEKELTVDKYDFVGNGVVVDFYELSSNTEYAIEIKPAIISNNEVYEVKTAYLNNKFKTFKQDASFNVMNLYIASGYIDFDAIIYDKDKAILQEDSALNVYDENNKLVHTQLLKNSSTLSNGDSYNLNHINLSKLDVDKKYTFKVVATDYDNGYKKQDNKVIDSIREYTLSGANGKLLIDKIIDSAYHKYETGEDTTQNLFNINNEARWKIFYESSKSITGTSSIKKDDNSIELLAKNGDVYFYYYVPELIGKKATVSFDAKLNSENGSTQKIELINGYKENKDKKVFDNLTLDYSNSRYNYTFTMQSSGYLIFHISEVNGDNNTTKVEIKDLMIAEGTSTDYRRFNDTSTYTALLGVSLNEPMENGIALANYVNGESSDLINGSDYLYYIRYECIGDNCSEQSNKSILNDYELPLINRKKELDVSANSSYKVYLSVYDSLIDRYYDLDSTEFISDAETRTIKNIDELLAMHRSGNYIVVDDIDFKSKNKTYGNFDGKIDFQGHTVYVGDGINNPASIFSTLGGSAEVKNLVIQADFRTQSGGVTTGRSALFTVNYGTISNVMLFINGINDAPNIQMTALGNENRGVIENFILKSNVEYIGARYMSYGVRYNIGIMKNGYAYGKDINLKFINDSNLNRDSGVFANYGSGGVFQNLYTLVNINVGDQGKENVECTGSNCNDNNIGFIAGSVSNSTVQNCYSYSDITNTLRKKDVDAFFQSASNSVTNELYYAAKEDYKESFSKKIIESYFKNADFQERILNSDNMFLVDDAWKSNSFPHLKMPDYMPAQEYVSLPGTFSSDNIQVLSVDKIESLSDSSDKYADEISQGFKHKITLSIFNPDNVYINSMNIDGFDDSSVKVMPQGANVDVNTKIGIYEIMIKDPIYYASNYSLLSMNVSKNSSNADLSFSNVSLKMDLFKEVNSLSEIESTLKTPNNKTVNFRLMNDIDYNTENDIIRITSNITGIVDGNNHTIKNLNGKNYLFVKLSGGTLKNIRFEDINFTWASGNDKFGIVATADKKANVENVAVNNMTIDAEGATSSDALYIGALVANNTNIIVTNSSVTSMKVKNVSDLQKAYVGGLTGKNNNSTVSNSYARKIDFDLSNNMGAVGGITGITSYGSVIDVFATGNISTDSNNVGGIIGEAQSSLIYSAIAKVNILARDYLGGVIGNTLTGSSRSVANNVLSLGNLTSKQKNSSTFHRAFGTDYEGGASYAWDCQLINSNVSSDTNGEILLSTTDLHNPLTFSSKIGLSEYYVLDDTFRVGYMPLLYSTKGELLTVLDDDFSDMEIKRKEPFNFMSIDYGYTYENNHNDDKYYANGVNVYELKLENADNHIINHISIGGLEIDESSFISTTDNNITTVSFSARPTSYFDSYLINSINYDDNQEFASSIKLEVQLFGKLSSVDDWNNINTSSAQNYIVTNDISFKGQTNISSGITFNRLIGYTGTDSNPTISDVGSENNHFILSNSSGFIDNVLSEVKNVNFANIYLKNNQKQNSSYSYLNLFKGINGEMTNVNFNNIEIINTAKTAYYTSIIGINQSVNIKNVSLNNVTASGGHYTASFIANSYALDKTGIEFKNCNVTGVNYVGGLIANESSDVVNVHNFNFEGRNITVTGSKYVGGVFGYGSGNGITLYNSNVTGVSDVGGIGGNVSNRTIENNVIYDSYVRGSSQTIGGLYGSNQYINYSYVVRTTIDGLTTANNIGGLVGSGGWQLTYCGVIDSKIINGNKNVGGLKGTLSWGNINQDFVYNTDVQGAVNVGGGVGYTYNYHSNIDQMMVNARVKATGSSAGGMLGRANNLNTTASENVTTIKRSIIANTTVNAPNYAGGLVGYLENDMFTGHFANDILAVNVSCSSDYCNAGYVSGYNEQTKISDNGIDNFTNWKIYLDSIVNGVKLSSLSEDDKKVVLSNGGKTVDKTYLSDFNSVKGIVGSNYEKDEGYYPRLKNMTAAFKQHFELPNDNTFSTNSNNLLSTSMLRTTAVNNLFTIPEYSVYSSDVDKINITFNNIDGYKNLSFKINDGEYINVDKKTYTMYYDYKEDIILHVKNGLNESVKVYTSEELVNSSSIVNDKFYHLSGSVIESNDEIKADNLSYKNDKYSIRLLSRTNIINNAVNVYNNKILLDNKNIYNIDTKEVEENDFNNFDIVEDKALYEYDYNDSKIKTYNDYSIINEKIVNKIVLANNKLEIINQSISNNAKNILSNSYNGYDYLLYLENGSLVSIKDKINYPKGFKNYNIKSINSKDNIIIVNYKGNDYVVFNYVTGEIIDEKKDYKPSIEEFIGDYFKGSQSDNKINMISDNYKEAKNIVSKLNAKSIDEVLNTDEDKSYVQKSNYSIVYNNLSNEYEIYEIPKEDNTLLVNNIISDNNVSDTINNNSVLFDYYVGKKNGVNVVSSIIIIAPIIGSIFIVIVILRRYFIVNKKVEK